CQDEDGGGLHSDQSRVQHVQQVAIASKCNGKSRPRAPISATRNLRGLGHARASSASRGGRGRMAVAAELRAPALPWAMTSRQPRPSVGKTCGKKQRSVLVSRKSKYGQALNWRALRDSNPCYRRERAVS